MHEDVAVDAEQADAERADHTLARGVKHVLHVLLFVAAEAGERRCLVPPLVVLFVAHVEDAVADEVPREQ